MLSKYSGCRCKEAGVRGHHDASREKINRIIDCTMYLRKTTRRHQQQSLSVMDGRKSC